MPYYAEEEETEQTMTGFDDTAESEGSGRRIEIGGFITGLIVGMISSLQLIPRLLGLDPITSFSELNMALSVALIIIFIIYIWKR